MVLSIKSYVKYQRKNEEVKRDVGLKENGVIKTPREYKERVIRLLEANKACRDKELDRTQTVTMKIDIREHPPLKLRLYGIPFHKRELVEQAIQEMLEAGIIERSQSLWSFPIVIAGKKDGGYRFCVDFRDLNKITKSIAYLLPLIDDILALLLKATRFSTLDFRAGYWQVAMDDFGSCLLGCQGHPEFSRS